MTPEYIDKIIETARHAGKKHPIHDTLKQVTGMQPDLVRDRIRNYLENTIEDFRGVPIKFSGAALENHMAYFVDNRKSVFDDAEAVIAEIQYDAKAKRIFADYRAGIAEITMKETEAKAVPVHVFKETVEPEKRREIIDAYITVAGSVAPTHPMRALFKGLVVADPEGVKERLAYKLHGPYGIPFVFFNDENKKNLADYYLDGKKGSINLMQRFLIGTRNRHLKSLIADYREAIGIISGKKSKQIYYENSIGVNSYIKGYEYTGDKIAPDNKMTGPKIF